MCCKGRKLTHEEKSAKKFNEYVWSLGTGVLASIVSLVLSAIDLSKAPGNAAMIWQIVLSIFTAIVLFALAAKAEKQFGVQGKLPTITSTPKGIYAINVLFILLWISSIVVLCVNWPTDSNGDSLDINKREFDFAGGSKDAGLDGVTWGCFSLDATFIIGLIQLCYQLGRSIHHAHKAKEARRATGTV